MAAFSTTTVWEFRAAGNVLNGGAFDPAIASVGTDYSQQDAAQLTVTDLVGNGTTTLTSVIGGFTSLMIGNDICLFDSGVVYRHMISAVASTNSITVTEATTTFTGVTGRVGGGILVFQSGFPYDKFNDGQKAWMKGTHAIQANAPTIPTTFSRQNPFTLEGYQNVRGDGGQATIQWVASGISCLTLSGVNIVCKNITADSQTNIFSGIVVSGNRIRLINCRQINGSDNWGIYVSGSDNVLENCLVDKSLGTQHQGIPCVLANYDINCNYCVFRGSSNTVGMSIDRSTVLYRCIIDDNAGTGVQMWTSSNVGFVMKNCNVVNNGGHGILNKSTEGGICHWNVEGCIFGDNTLYDLKYEEADISALKGAIQTMSVAFVGNCFYNGGSGKYSNLPSTYSTQEIDLGGDPFVDAVNGDYSLDMAGFGADVRDSAFTIDFPDNVNVATIIAGAITPEPGNIPPNDPTGCTAVVISSVQIDVSWVDVAADEEFYVIERNDNGAGFESLALLPPDTDTYSDTTVQPNTTYQYRVKAVN